MIMIPEQPFSEEQVEAGDIRPDILPSVEQVEIGQELKRGVIVAEDLARAKEEIQKRMFKEDMPAAEWHTAVDEYLSEHPDLNFYRPVMMDAIKRARSAHDRIEQITELCRSTHSDQTVESQESEKMRAEIAKDLFRTIFEKDSHGKVEFIKGVTSITFIVEREDFDSVYPLKHAFLVDGTVMHRREIPILLVVRNSELPESQWQASLSTMMHEAEHTKNSALRSAREWFSGSSLKHYLFLTELNGLDKKLRKVEKGNIPMEEYAKDEILAYFTSIEFSDSTQGTEEDKNNFAKINIDYIKEELCGDKGYLIGYTKNFKPDEETKKRYLENVNGGIDAIARLREFYREQGMECFDRRAMDVLEQFPLHRWPVVVRLVKARHAQSEELDHLTATTAY